MITPSCTFFEVCGLDEQQQQHKYMRAIIGIMIVMARPNPRATIILKTLKEMQRQFYSNPSQWHVEFTKVPYYLFGHLQGVPINMVIKKINKQILNSCRQNNRGSAFLAGIIMLNQKLIYKNEIKIVTELSCFIGTPCMERFVKF